MQKAARRGDLCTGHDACPPRPAQRGSPDVTVNDRPSLRITDPYLPHGCNAHAPHPGQVAAGSATVTMNDKPAARVGDAVSCGGSIQLGSGDVLIGG